MHSFTSSNTSTRERKHIIVAIAEDELAPREAGSHITNKQIVGWLKFWKGLRCCTDKIW
jgi:hypothetical protein